MPINLVSLTKGKAPVYRTSQVEKIAPDGEGYLVQFDCKHIAWVRRRTEIGKRMCCSVCLFKILMAIRKRANKSGVA